MLVTGYKILTFQASNKLLFTCKISFRTISRMLYTFAIEPLDISIIICEIRTAILEFTVRYRCNGT